jgi:hypothetical protein
MTTPEARALQASPGYADVLAAALAPKHEPRYRKARGRSYLIWCTCSPDRKKAAIGSLESAKQAAYHLVDAHNRKARA